MEVQTVNVVNQSKKLEHNLFNTYSEDINRDIFSLDLHPAMTTPILHELLNDLREGGVIWEVDAIQSNAADIAAKSTRRKRKFCKTGISRCVKLFG